MMTETETCPACNGTGETGQYECWFCDGSGEVDWIEHDEEEI